MSKILMYIHGRGGSPSEADHFHRLFPERKVIAPAVSSLRTGEAGREIARAAEGIREGEDAWLIANSIGAFLAVSAGIGPKFRKAFFISPIVDMERLILDLMARENVTEEALRAAGRIPTAFGEDLVWEELCSVRERPVRWDVPTEILYGGKDLLTSRETISAFAENHRARLTVYEEGEHWFHTEDQMRFLDGWIVRSATFGT